MRYVALLRAVNVGGTGRLPMSVLRDLCRDAGFRDVRTYIASGNAVFSSALAAGAVRQALSDRLQAHTGKPVGVLILTADEMAAVLSDNPFADRDPKVTVAIFLDSAPPEDALDHATGRADESVRLGRRVIYVWYPSGQGRSKLRIPAAAAGTARNMNTVAKLSAMAAAP